MEEDIYVSRVMRSLKKSMVRTEILMYLYKIYPNASYPTGISKKTEIDATNVLGGLRGMGNWYRQSESLIGMELVEILPQEDSTYYKISEKGKRVIESIDLLGR